MPSKSKKKDSKPDLPLEPYPATTEYQQSEKVITETKRKKK